MTQVAYNSAIPAFFDERSAKHVRAGTTLNNPSWGKVVPFGNDQVDLNRGVSFLKGLSSWPKNWNGYGSKPPKKLSIKMAARLLQRLYNQSKQLNERFILPNITADESGDIVFEYWRGSKKISLYISPSVITCLKVPSEDIASMEEEHLDFSKLSDQQRIFGWLQSP